MPKAEKGTPKDLANKMKAKGLQKLRWFCQMCQKQCRDENGFKCHTMSESHQRQLLLFADNPNKYLDEFSKEFTTGFVDLLRRRFGTKRVFANQVYQEYISDRNHLHMNATRWLSLTQYVKWLGRQGICTVDETEKGWYITWIDRDPETLARQASEQKKKKMDKDDEERLHEFIEKQVERAKAAQQADKTVEYTELQRKSEDEKVVENIVIKPVAKVQPIASASTVFKELKRKDDDTFSMKSFKSSSSSKTSEKRKLSALEEIRLEEERRKQMRMKKEASRQDKLSDRQDDRWLTEGIVVKVITKDLGDKYYKKKGVVVRLIDDYTAIVKIFDTESKLKLDQAHMETVIPNIDRELKILKGKYMGCTGLLKRINEEKYSVDVEIQGGPWDGTFVRSIPYEEVSKLYRSD